MEKNQLKYAQQHLANERTFLAWVRTVIAIVGVGFLATSLHFTIGVHRDPRIDLISIVLGMCALGLVITVLATFGYLQKKRQINEGAHECARYSNRCFYGHIVIDDHFIFCFHKSVKLS
ncbi:YidH family protein [Peribacillus phoenicis]|uniref:YidH family protein n=1 Tax=unclassified Peribacillus TaxID=2675266 RepID=UPI0039A043AB